MTKISLEHFVEQMVCTMNTTMEWVTHKFGQKPTPIASKAPKGNKPHEIKAFEIEISI